MNIKNIQEIINLEQLDGILESCKATPTSEIMPGGSFYKLKSRDFRYPNGSIQRREFVDKRPATIVVPEDPAGKLIMVVQPTALTEEGALIEFPAGYAEPGEDDKTAGIRELLEETGLATESKHITDLGCHYQDPGLIRQPVHIYLAEYCQQIQKPKPDHGEYIQLYKVRKGLFFEMLRAGYIKDANTYIAGIQALFYLGILEY